MKTHQSITRRNWIAASSGLMLSASTFQNAFGHIDVNQQEEEKQLIFRTDDPRNGEPELNRLVENWITPTELFYVRSHAPNPVINPDEFRVQVTGMVRNELSLSLTDLHQFKMHSTTLTMTCAGNRRAEYNQEGKVGGVQWGSGAIGNAHWSGVALADVLRKAEVLEGAKHVWFEGLDQIQRKDSVIPFGASIPISRAMDTAGNATVLLADQMNHALLTPDHGFPLRTVVPGYIGARSVKWLGKIVVSDRPSPNHYVATAYKIVKKTEPIDWQEAGPIYRFPINGVICSPQTQSAVKPGKVKVAGYALPTGRAGCAITKVLLSSDEGKTWQQANLGENKGEYCWQLWDAEINVQANTKTLLMRAEDSSGGFMPARVPWNAKGYLQNSWYRLPVKSG